MTVTSPSWYDAPCTATNERTTVDIQQSLKQVLESETLFGENFYTTFFEQCPESKAMFDGIDMKRQALLITMALTLIEQHYTHGYASVAQYLRHLGSRHKAKDIPEALYPRWRDAMLTTLEEFHGDDWNDTLATQWREAIEGVSESMLSGYDEHVGF